MAGKCDVSVFVIRVSRLLRTERNSAGSRDKVSDLLQALFSILLYAATNVDNGDLIAYIVQGAHHLRHVFSIEAAGEHDT